MANPNIPFKVIDNNEKKMPCNIEAEQSVIGSILVSNEIYDEVLTKETKNGMPEEIILLAKEK